MSPLFRSLRLITGGVFGAVALTAAPETECISPARAIQLAAAAAPNGVKGVFELTVEAVGRANGNVYLNSAWDYRDPATLSIEITPVAIDDFHARFGHDPDQLLKGRRIRVHGEVLRVKIMIAVNGRTTDQFYYQTHVAVTEARQIELVSPGPLPPAEKEIDTGTVTLEEIQHAVPGRPALAEYQLQLQKRIDEAFFEALRDLHFAGGGATGSGHGIRLILTVLADGRLGADKQELALREAQEPLLTAAALRALSRITETPIRFSPELRKEVGSSFNYTAHFYIR